MSRESLGHAWSACVADQVDAYLQEHLVGWVVSFVPVGIADF